MTDPTTPTDKSRPPTLDYDEMPSPEYRAKIVRQLMLVIALKVVMVAVNVGLAFSTVGTLPRMIGIGIQLGLTGVFLVLLFKLMASDRPTR